MKSALATKLEERFIENREDLLYYFYNDLGCDGLKMCMSWKKANGEIRFSKWVSYDKMMHYAQDEIIPEVGITRREFVKGISHRTVLDIELCIDIDEKGKFDSIKSAAKNICTRLDTLKIQYSVYFTGSKSYHITLKDESWRYMNKSWRDHQKKQLLEMLGGDLQKASCNVMIAMEGAVHYRSGTPKIEVEL